MQQLRPTIEVVQVAGVGERRAREFAGGEGVSGLVQVRDRCAQVETLRGGAVLKAIIT
ncbi:hypothetical protein [Pseudonocardia alni]|uniref:hypothetical protein n=1 Tax=Pseudonocardia alni TaxID=33907 RepID=UPI00331F191E